MTRQKLNGYAKWVAIGITVSLLLYNAVVTSAIHRNDLKHLKEDVQEIKTLLIQHIESH